MIIEKNSIRLSIEKNKFEEKLETQQKKRIRFGRILLMDALII